MDTNKMRDPVREQFETAYAGESTRRNSRFYPEVLTRGDDGDYVIPSVQSAWWAWQASRAAAVVELPRITGHEYDPLADADYREGCRQAIEAQGLKVAP